MIFVDDGSSDGTRDILVRLAEADARVTFVELRRNFGQTPALAAGFDHAAGEIVIAMDGDLQHAPEDIPAMLKPLDEGYDLVSGWRKRRVDNFFIRRLPSATANWLMKKLSGVDIHDFGTTFKAYKRDLLAAHPPVRRTAPVHSGPGLGRRRPHLRGADPEHRAAEGQVQVRPRPDGPRHVRPADGPVPHPVLYAAAAFHGRAGPGHAGPGAGHRDGDLHREDR